MKKFCTIEIYWNDLTEEKQKEIKEVIKEDGHNWDFFPMASFEIEIDEEE